MNNFDNILRILTDSGNNFKNLKCLELAETLIDILFPSGNYNRYYDDMMDISIYKAQIFANSEPQLAISELKKAEIYAKRFDDLFMQTPVSIPFDSPYMNLLSFDSNDLSVYGSLENNKRTDSFKWQLSGQIFDLLRNQKEFTELT